MYYKQRTESSSISLKLFALFSALLVCLPRAFRSWCLPYGTPPVLPSFGAAPTLPRQLQREQSAESLRRRRSPQPRAEQLLGSRRPCQKNKLRRSASLFPERCLQAKLGSASAGDSASRKTNWKPGLHLFYFFFFQVIIPKYKCYTKHQFCNLCSEPLPGRLRH